jgi:CheY-like chemotaxis protein
MPQSDHEFAIVRRPTADRPLLGQAVLVVEDSRHAGETMRLMCLRGGARVRRADSLRSAEKHLAVYRPSIALVDLGLPDGDGLSLIRRLKEGPLSVSALLAVSGDPGLQADALDAGADDFLAKPFGSIAAFHTAILSRLPAGERPKGPRLVTDEQISVDEDAIRDDLTLIADLLGRGEDRATIAYALNFARGLARAIGDAELLSAVARAESAFAGGEVPAFELGGVSATVRDRLTGARIAV